LAEWLADRGIAVGDSGKRKDSGGSGGVGSDVFRRFAASMSKSGDSGGRGAVNGARKSPTPAPAKASTAPEEDFALAPLDEEGPAKISLKPAAEIAKSATATSEAAGPANVEAKPIRPKRSLIEEELELAQKSIPPRPRGAQVREGDFDPLKPPGFVGPSYGTPAWVFVAIGFAVFAVIGVVLALVFGAV
jgi:hypothetical protein